MTGRSKSRPDATLDPWAGSSARDRPGIPPLAPRNKDQSAKFLQSEDIFVKQLVAVSRVCVCADAAKNDYLTLRNHCVQLETQWGPPLFEAPGCHLAVAMSSVTLLYVADANNTIQESIWVGRQTSPQGGTRFRMLRAQFWSLAQSKYISEGTQKWTLLGSKVVPPGRPVFGPFILSDVLKLCKLLCVQNFKLEATFTQTASAAGILNWGDTYLRL